MSTITWDGITMASDRRVIFNDINFDTSKIKAFPDSGILAAACGNSSIALSMFKWIGDGMDPLKWAELRTITPPDADRVFHALVIINLAPFLIVDHPEPVPIYNDFVAIGSGSHFAMAAMHAGRTAVQAIEIAEYYDAYTGGGCDSYTWCFDTKQYKHAIEWRGRG
jgi:hypothetical protein